MNTVGEGLDEAVQRAFTRPAPKSAGAQMRYLVKQLKGTRAVAALLGITQRTVERYVRNQLKKPRPDLAARMDREVKRRWQPQIQAKARKAAATTDGIVIDTRARFGYTAAPAPPTTPGCATSPWRFRPRTRPGSSRRASGAAATGSSRRSRPRGSRRSTSRTAGAGRRGSWWSTPTWSTWRSTSDWASRCSSRGAVPPVCGRARLLDGRALPHTGPSARFGRFGRFPVVRTGVTCWFVARPVQLPKVRGPFPVQPAAVHSRTGHPVCS